MNQPGKLSQAPSSPEPGAITAVDFEAPGQGGQTSAGAPGTDWNAGANGKIISRYGLQAKPGARWWHSQFNLMLGVFALLVLAAVLFVILTPPPNVSQQSVTGTAPVNSNPSLPAADAPWTESQRAAARSESQSILKKLLDRKKSLETMDVQQWAPERYQQALDDAARGDEFYKLQNFTDAISSYQAAVEQMDSLVTLLPSLIKTRLAAAELAINEGKSALARDLYSKVLVLDAGNAAASAGRDRANKLDEVLQLITAADRQEAKFKESRKLEDLLSAEKTYLKAQQLDAAFEPVVAGLARVQTALVERRFELAMSAAYGHLFANRYAAARKAFGEALQYKPGDPTAAAALQQSLASDSRSSLSSLLANAKAYEAKEEWTSAQSNYRTALQRDPNQVEAKLGNIRTSARRQLDLQIRELLQDTLSFGLSERKDAANRVLADARAVRDKGPKLRQQIEQLQAALAQSEISIKVSFISDSLTDVSLQKIGSKALSLGKFSNKNLSLKPGRYVARGVRLGYQDVRTEIELVPGRDEPRSITIRCNQPINSSQKNS